MSKRVESGILWGLEGLCMMRDFSDAYGFGNQ